jgi:anti-anti-sigma factor
MNNNPDICSNSNVAIRKAGGEVTISIAGDFNSSTTPAIHRCCKEITKSGMVERVVIDFDKARHVDSTAFACIISFIKEHLKDIEIRVVNLHDPEKNLLEILKVEKIIKVKD